MEQRTRKHAYAGPDADFARAIKTAIACVSAGGMLLLAACNDGGPIVIKDALAGPAEIAAGYLPAQFPSPAGAPEPHVEAF